MFKLALISLIFSLQVEAHYEVVNKHCEFTIVNGHNISMHISCQPWIKRIIKEDHNVMWVEFKEGTLPEVKACSLNKFYKNLTTNRGIRLDPREFSASDRIKIDCTGMRLL